MDIHIPHIDFTNPNRQSLFILTRPFYSATGWKNDKAVRNRWRVAEEFQFTETITTADVLFIPHPVNTYSKKQLEEFNALCVQHNIRGYGYISGDFGKRYPEHSNLVYFRMGGFKSQLNHQNKGLPVQIYDQWEKRYQRQTPEIRTKQAKPVVGFCGHASLSARKKLKEQLVFVKENLRRFFAQPGRTDYEPLFASGYERAKLLQALEKSKGIKTNFIYRNKYRAGGVTGATRATTTLEYFDNIKNSDYILCVRGVGNFSVRLYETLMMGRIPVFVNTDCLLPFEDKIDWKKHLVWVEWKDRQNISKAVTDFHNNISEEAFSELQQANRTLWKETLSVNAMLQYLKT